MDPANEIEDFGAETIGSIRLLIAKNFYLQALIVLYSAIDTCAWIRLVAGDVSRSDFCEWVEAYMQPQSQLDCTAEDLYGARCGLLHSGATESSLSRKGDVSQLFYATSKNLIPAVVINIDQLGVRGRIIYVTDLVAAFGDGIMTFAEEVASYAIERQQEITSRLRWMIRFVSLADRQKQEPDDCASRTS
jgi:hypothetical protein